MLQDSRLPDGKDVALGIPSGAEDVRQALTAFLSRYGEVQEVVKSGGAPGDAHRPLVKDSGKLRLVHTLSYLTVNTPLTRAECEQRRQFMEEASALCERYRMKITLRGSGQLPHVLENGVRDGRNTAVFALSAID